MCRGGRYDPMIGKIATQNNALPAESNGRTAFRESSSAYSGTSDGVSRNRCIQVDAILTERRPGMKPKWLK
jgi:hypothetical protein